MTRPTVAIARASYEAWARKDRAAIEARLAEDFHFTSPLDHRLEPSPSPSTIRLSMTVPILRFTGQLERSRWL